MTTHKPNVSYFDMVVVPDGNGVMLTVPCECGRPNCVYTRWLANYDWNHIPVAIPDNKFLLASKIGAIKEIRDATKWTLKESKDEVDLLTESRRTHKIRSTHEDSGCDVTIVLTLLPDNPPMQ